MDEVMKTENKSWVWLLLCAHGDWERANFLWEILSLLPSLTWGLNFRSIITRCDIMELRISPLPAERLRGLYFLGDHCNQARIPAITDENKKLEAASKKLEGRRLWWKYLPHKKCLCWIKHLITSVLAFIIYLIYHAPKDNCTALTFLSFY